MGRETLSAGHAKTGNGTMRIAVNGAGGVGGGFGAALAKAGGDVTFVARGAHLAAMRENGLRVEGDRGETLIRPETAVIPLQNGIDASDRLVPILGAAHVMAGTVGISATIASPGVIRQT